MNRTHNKKDNVPQRNQIINERPNTRWEIHLKIIIATTWTRTARAEKDD